MQKYTSIAEAREKLLAASPAALARLAGLTEQRVVEIEAETGEAATLSELVAIGRVLGIDEEELADPPIHVAEAVTALALVDEYQEISVGARADILAAATAAEDTAELESLLEQPNRWDTYRKRACLHRPPAWANKPYARGKHFAEVLRADLGLDPVAPIPSLASLMEVCFPEILVLHAALGDPKLAGVSLADRVRGPLIVLNVDGKNANPLVRRFSLAHELCHLLEDRSANEPLALLSGFYSDARLEIEQVANSFATRFLCPDEAVRRLHTEHDGDSHAVARQIVQEYGLHYQAARLLLRNVLDLECPPNMRVAVPERWLNQEAGAQRLRLEGVPLERQTLVAELAARAYSKGVISRSRLRELLRVDALAPLDYVLGFFGLDTPDR